MKRMIGPVLLVILACGFACGQEYVATVEKFKACDDEAGGGLYWVDTTTGKTWRADPGAVKWVDCGKPEGAEPGPPGTYIPRDNKGEAGVFVLNTATGEGWWTDGTEWKSLGKPSESA